ncbi:hypothetical protein INR49_001817, partial [Caranx melampygus]
KDEVRGQLDSALQDVNVRYAVLEDTEKRAVCRALIEERARYCSFRCSSPYLLIGSDEYGRSLSEGNSPSRLGRQGSRGRYGYAAGHGHHPASSRHVSRRDMTSVRKHSIPPSPSSPDHCVVAVSVKRDPPLYVDYESISLHGDADSISLHHLSHGNSQSDFDKSSTIPRNSDLSLQYRKFAQSKRPSSTVSLLAEPELIGGSVRQLPSHTATIRRKPSSKPAYRRGTISGGVPIPISTPQVPMKALGGNGGSEENVFIVPPAGGAGGLGYNKLCTSTQSLSALPPSSPYYQLVPGQMPIPVPVPTVPSLPPEGIKQQQQRQYQQHNQQIQLQQQQQQQQQQQHSDTISSSNSFSISSPCNPNHNPDQTSTSSRTSTSS